MSIKRTTTQYDVEHGGTFNKNYVAKGVTYYEDNEETNAADKHVNSPDLTFTDTEHLEEGEEYPHLDVNGDENVTHDTDIGHNLTVHNDTEVEGNTHLIGKPEGEDGTEENEPALTVENNTLLKGQKDEDDEYTGYALDVEGKTHLENTLEVENKSWFRDDVDIHGTTTITGDLHVKGTSYEEHAVDLNVGADFVRVRENAEVALADGERSGIIINKYDGTDSLGIVADPHGTLRIGEFNTVKVYTKDDVTYYSDRELTEEIEIPEGKSLYQIGIEDPETGLKEYYFIAKDETEPVATRAPSDELENEHLVKWDSDGEDFINTATTSENIKQAIILGKNLEQRVIDLEEGKLNINTTDQYPLEITRTDGEEYLPIENSLTSYMTRVSDEVNENYDEYKASVPLYKLEDDGTTYTEYTEYFYYDKQSDIWVYGADFENAQPFSDVYVKVGNKESNNYKWEINQDNVIRYFDTYQDFIDLRDASLNYEHDDRNILLGGPKEGEVALVEGNVVMIRNAFGTTDDINFPVDIDEEVSSPIGITDIVQAGNFNPVTSNAVARAMINGMAEALADGTTIKATDAEYKENTDSAVVLRNRYFYASGEPRAISCYTLDPNGSYFALDRVETNEDVVPNEYTFYYFKGVDVEESFTVASDEVITLYTIKTASLLRGNYDNNTIGYDSSIEAVKVNIDTEPSDTSELPLVNRQVVALHSMALQSTANEKSRAETAEATLQANIDTEVNDRTTAITQEVTDRNTAITNAINTEVTNRNTAITNAINNLDVNQIGNTSTYIQYISETNGKISAQSATFPTQPTFTLSGTTLYITR